MNASLDAVLAGASVEAAVRARYPDYVAVLVAATGLTPGPSTAHGDALLSEAEAQTGRVLAGREPHDLPEVLTWRHAYAGFGVKPREARSSIEALLRRAPAGLPRIDRLTDVYNAVSVLHLLPIGGEDLSGYEGAARLVVATGEEPFDTIVDGQPTVTAAASGEIVWRDDAGVTCRRWNWRQCVRTRLTDATTDALFIVDGLGPEAEARAHAAAEHLVAMLLVDSPDASFATRACA